MAKKIKVIKGVIFLIIGILFLFATFYNIREVVEYEESAIHLNFIHAISYANFDDYFTPTILNYLFSALFIVLGFLNIGEAFTDE